MLQLVRELVSPGPRRESPELVRAADVGEHSLWDRQPPAVVAAPCSLPILRFLGALGAMELHTGVAVDSDVGTVSI